MKPETFATYILGAWGKGHELSILIDGTPATICFRKELSLCLPYSCKDLPEVKEWTDNSGPMSEGHAFVCCPDKNTNESLVAASVDLLIHTSDGVVKTESSELTIDTSAVSMVGFGSFAPIGATV